MARGAIQDGHLDRVDIDENVVDPGGVDRRKEMFGGGKKHACFIKLVA